MPSTTPDRLRPAPLILNKTAAPSTAPDGLRLGTLNGNATAAPSAALEGLQLVPTVAVSTSPELQDSVFWPILQLPQLNKGVLRVSVIVNAIVQP